MSRNITFMTGERQVALVVPFPGRSAARSFLAERCAAEPGPYHTPVRGTVPALRSSVKNAAARPGHAIASGTRLHLHHALAAAFAGEQADQGLRCILQALDDVFLHFQPAVFHP